MKNKKFNQIIFNGPLVFALFIIVALTMSSCTRGQRKEAARDSALQYAAELFPKEGVTATCSTDDGDEDGYISCDLVINGKIIPISCNYSYLGRTTGCKKRPLMK